MRASWTGSAALAISISFRTAASGSLNGLGSANFTGFVLGWDVLTACRIFDGASVNRARKLACRNTMASALNATFQHRDRRSTDTGRYPHDREAADAIQIDRIEFIASPSFDIRIGF